MRRKLISTLFVLGFWVEASAAEIAVRVLDGVQIIVVSGTLEFGDDKTFVAAALPLDDALVVLSGPGGNLHAGIQIGRAIRLKNFDTLVPGGSECASACALAWLGGSRRGLPNTAQVGFHSASKLNANGTLETVGPANALVGAYLNQLGLSTSAIVYLTEAAPGSMRWLSPAEARARAIDLHAIGSSERPSNGHFKARACEHQDCVRNPPE
jgi:hypothetical protein